MKSIFIIFLLAPLFSMSQDALSFEENEIVCKRVDTIAGMEQLKIFNKANQWAASNMIVLTESKEEGVITGRATFNIYIGKGIYRGDHIGKYNFEITCKDNRYRFKIYNIFYENVKLEVIHSLCEKDEKNKKIWGDIPISVSIEFKKKASSLFNTLSKKDDF